MPLWFESQRSFFSYVSLINVIIEEVHSTTFFLRCSLLLLKKGVNFNAKIKIDGYYVRWLTQFRAIFIFLTPAFETVLAKVVLFKGYFLTFS